MSEMENVITTLIQADAEAQATLHEHQQRRQQMADTVNADKKELLRTYDERAQRRIEKIRALHRSDYEKELLRMQQSYEKSLDELGRAFREHGEEWVDTLVSRCLE